MPRPKIHDDELRTRLLERAGRIVAMEGIEALNLRALAGAEGTSTTAVYALFGGKAHLLSALHGGAFRSFGEAQRRAVTGDDALVDLSSLGASYHAWAIANPWLYIVMFSGALTGVEPVADEATEAIAPLLATVTRLVDEGQFLGDPLTIALSIWGMAHGIVSLELSGVSPVPTGNFADVFEQGCFAIAKGWSADPVGFGQD